MAVTATGQEPRAHRSVRLWATALGFCIIFDTGAALAYRTGADLSALASVAGDSPVRWEMDVAFEVHEDGVPGFDADEVQSMVQEVLETWTTPGCASVLPTSVDVNGHQAAASDGRSTLEAVHSGWEKRGFDKSAPAATEVEYLITTNPPHIEIAEADIYFNAEHFTFVEGSDKGTDLRTLLTHEIGHALGLLHPCGTAATPEPDAPNCASATRFDSSVMHPDYRGTETALGVDDIDGICFLYGTTSEQPSTCEDDDSCPDAAMNQPDAGVPGPTVPDEPQPFGTACDDGGDCKSTVCLGQSQSAPVCTRLCGDGHPACPGGWSCSELDDSQVCTPIEKRGCSIAGTRLGGPAGHPGRGSRTLASCLLAGLCYRRRRSRQVVGSENSNPSWP